jgi:hypothetical protein
LLLVALGHAGYAELFVREIEERKKERDLFISLFLFSFFFFFSLTGSEVYPAPRWVRGGDGMRVSLPALNMGPVPWLGPDMGSGAMAFAALAVALGAENL